MNGLNLHFQRLQANDLHELMEISRSTYEITFASANTPENMKAYLDRAFNEAQLAKELAEPETEFYFAKAGEETLGYIKINMGQAQTDLKEDEGLEVERVYVLHEHQGKKIGKSMLDFAIATARERGKAYVWLGVWEHNKPARAFYDRYGFREIGSHPFVMGDDVQTDFVLRLDLIHPE